MCLLLSYRLLVQDEWKYGRMKNKSVIMSATATKPFLILIGRRIKSHTKTIKPSPASPPSINSPHHPQTLHHNGSRSQLHHRYRSLSFLLQHHSFYTGMPHSVSCLFTMTCLLIPTLLLLCIFLFSSAHSFFSSSWLFFSSSASLSCSKTSSLIKASPEKPVFFVVAVAFCVSWLHSINEPLSQFRS